MNKKFPEECNFWLGIDKECDGYTYYGKESFVNEEPLKVCKVCPLFSFNIREKIKKEE